jgi:hypothetical protein
VPLDSFLACGSGRNPRTLGRESAHLSRGHLCGLDVTAMDRTLEASVCCPLRRRDDYRWGNGKASLFHELYGWLRMIAPLMLSCRSM